MFGRRKIKYLKDHCTRLEIRLGDIATEKDALKKKIRHLESVNKDLSYHLSRWQPLADLISSTKIESKKISVVDRGIEIIHDYKKLTS